MRAIALTLLLAAGACSGGAAKTGEDPGPTLTGRWKGDIKGDLVAGLVADFDTENGSVQKTPLALDFLSPMIFQLGGYTFTCLERSDTGLTGTWFYRDGRGVISQRGDWTAWPTKQALVIDLDTGVVTPAEIEIR